MNDAVRLPRPAPILTEDSEPFWSAAREKRLVVQRCDGCGRLHHPPRPMCPSCGSTRHNWAQMSGAGTVYSFSVLHHPQHPVFDYPLVAVLVDLAEGVRLLSNLIDVDPDEVRIGMQVQVAFLDVADESVIPVFRREHRP